MENLNRIHNMKTLEDLSPGDLIEFPRGAYSHWGVYLGDEDVVHLAGEDNDGLNARFKPEHMFTICGVKFDKARVCIDNFWRVVDKCKARRNNSADKKMSRFKTRNEEGEHVCALSYSRPSLKSSNEASSSSSPFPLISKHPVPLCIRVTGCGKM